MKQCSYCGKDYPDDAMLCAIDGQELENLNRVEQRDAVRAGNIPPITTARDIDVVYPEYQWSALDAWKYLGMTAVLGVIWSVGIGALDASVHHFSQWRWSPSGVVIVRTLWVGMMVLTAAYFARTESFKAFCSAVGFDRKPSNYVWFGMTAALGIRLIGHIIYVMGWARTYSDSYDLKLFRTAHGPERYLYLFPLILAAFWEEPVRRGFMYKAFRNSYPMSASIALIIACTAYTHWNQYVHFGWAVISLSGLTVVQCYLREKSDSIWDCVLCHLVFNGSTLFTSGFLS